MGANVGHDCLGKLKREKLIMHIWNCKKRISIFKFNYRKKAFIVIAIFKCFYYPLLICIKIMHIYDKRPF